MGVTFGGGVLFVVAAVIIAAIIVPRVVRRREESETLKHQERLERAIAALAATEHEIADARVVESARDAVTREKVMQQQRKREAAERRARIARAKAEVAEARLKARQAELERRAKLRAARLQTVFVRRLRGLAALGFLLAVLGVLPWPGRLPWPGVPDPPVSLKLKTLPALRLTRAVGCASNAEVKH